MALNSATKGIDAGDVHIDAPLAKPRVVADLVEVAAAFEAIERSLKILRRSVELGDKDLQLTYRVTALQLEAALLTQKLVQMQLGLLGQ